MFMVRLGNSSAFLSEMHLREFVRQIEEVLSGKSSYADIGTLSARVVALSEGGISIELRTDMVFPPKGSVR